MVHGKFCGSPHLVAPVATNSCGTFLAFMYFWIAELDWRAERLEHQQHLVALHQLARLLDGLRRAEGVVIADEIDLAAVDAALGVDLLEIGRLRLADGAIGRRRTAIGHDIADLDLGIAGAGIVFLLGRRRGPSTRRLRQTPSGQQHVRMRSSIVLSPCGLVLPKCRKPRAARKRRLIPPDETGIVARRQL